MTQPRPLTGQDIGQAHHATRAVLERRLAETGLPFNSWIAINLLGSSPEPALDENELVSRVVQGLKITDDAVRLVITNLTAQALVAIIRTENSTRLALTPAGTARFEAIRTGIAEITERLYGGLPSEDLLVAHRVLATVTARADAELAR